MSTPEGQSQPFRMQVYAQRSARLKDMAAFRNDLVLQWHETQHKELEARRCPFKLPSYHLLHARCHAATCAETTDISDRCELVSGALAA